MSHHNAHCTPFVWTATADAMLDKVKRFCVIVEPDTDGNLLVVVTVYEVSE